MKLLDSHIGRTMMFRYIGIIVILFLSACNLDSKNNKPECEGRCTEFNVDIQPKSIIVDYVVDENIRGKAIPLNSLIKESFYKNSENNTESQAGFTVRHFSEIDQLVIVKFKILKLEGIEDLNLSLYVNEIEGLVYGRKPYQGKFSSTHEKTVVVNFIANKEYDISISHGTYYGSDHQIDFEVEFSELNAESLSWSKYDMLYNVEMIGTEVCDDDGVETFEDINQDYVIRLNQGENPFINIAGEEYSLDDNNIHSSELIDIDLTLNES